MTGMVNVTTRLGPDRAIKEWADWTDRVAAGELPKAKPPRPQGVERNLVLTIWDWSDPKFYLHDMIATDRRKPTVNANGKIYGAHENSFGSGAGPRPGDAHRVLAAASAARPQDAVASHRSDDAVALLGRRGDLGRAGQRPQPDDGREGSPLVHGALASGQQSGVLPAGL